MKTVIRIALCASLILGCGGAGSSSDLKSQVEDLNRRVKFLEDDLLKADKQLIQQQQAMQQMHEQMRDMQAYFDKLQYSQSVPK